MLVFPLSKLFLFCMSIIKNTSSFSSVVHVSALNQLEVLGGIQVDGFLIQQQVCIILMNLQTDMHVLQASRACAPDSPLGS